MCNATRLLVKAEEVFGQMKKDGITPNFEVRFLFESVKVLLTPKFVYFCIFFLSSQESNCFRSLFRVFHRFHCFELNSFSMNIFSVDPPHPTPVQAYTIMLRLFAEFEDRVGAQPYLAEMKYLGYELRSRSVKLSIPTFFTMSDADRYVTVFFQRWLYPPSSQIPRLNCDSEPHVS
jgi:pentatricopeptide repeat protein